jgi:hypothetical protein
MLPNARSCDFFVPSQLSWCLKKVVCAAAATALLLLLRAREYLLFLYVVPEAVSDATNDTFYVKFQ